MNKPSRCYVATLAAVAIIGSLPVEAALFTAQTNQTDIPNLYNSRAAWCDFNRDGYLDFAITGTVTGTTTGMTRVYRWDNAAGKFLLAQALADSREGNLGWADFNRDGQMDLLVTGTAPNGQGGFAPVTYIYGNTGPSQGYFLSRLDPASTGLPATIGSAQIGDFNRDGRPDVLIVGDGNGNAFTGVYQNFSDFWFTAVSNTGLAAVGQEPAAAIADLDSNGVLDVILSGKDNTNTAILRMYQGKGDGTFTQKLNLAPGLWDGAIAIGDFDGTGRPDFAAIGKVQANGASMAVLFRNDGGFVFTNIATSGLEKVYCTGLQFGDVNNDGKADLILAGFNNTSSPTRRAAHVYLNKGATANPVFAEDAADANSLQLVDRGFAILGDYNQDRKLDLLLGGKTQDNGANPHLGKTILYKNTGAPSRSAPAQPHSTRIYAISADGSQTAAKITWTGSTDRGVTYGVEVAEKENSNYYLINNGYFEPSGKRLVPMYGNPGSLKSFLVNGIADDAILRFQVQSIDLNLAGSYPITTMDWKILGNVALNIIPAGVPIDLTKEGKLDWVHWGKSLDFNTNDRKNTATSVIVKMDRTTNFPLDFAYATSGTMGWNDAKIPGTISGVTSGIKCQNSFQGVVKGVTTHRLIRVYFSGNATGMVYVFDFKKGRSVSTGYNLSMASGGLHMATINAAIYPNQSPAEIYFDVANATPSDPNTWVAIHAVTVE